MVGLPGRRFPSEHRHADRSLARHEPVGVARGVGGDRSRSAKRQPYPLGPRAARHRPGPPGPPVRCRLGIGGRADRGPNPRRALGRFDWRRTMTRLLVLFLIVFLASFSLACAAPVRTDPPNVPENKPAFPEQTRAPEVKTSTPLRVTEIASGFNLPWAIAFLADGRYLVTEKPTGRLFIVTPRGAKSKLVSGLPRVDGRGQGGLLDVELAPDFPKSRMIYWSYCEPRRGGNGL